MTKPRIKVKARSRPLADVAFFDGMTTLDLPPSRIIEGATVANLESIVVLGYTAGGDEYFVASSISSGSDVLWLLKRLERVLLSVEPEHLPPMADNPEGRVLPFQKPGRD